MSSSTPLVSIVIPTYNRKEAVRRAIESVLEQGLSDWELIVVDDHSTDETVEVLREYSEADARIRYCANNNKKGPAGARNAGIERATGKYVAFLDSDDIWYPNHLEDCVLALRNENAQVAWGLWGESCNGVLKERYSGQFFIDLIVKELKPLSRNGYFVFNQHLLEYLFLRKYYILNTSTIVFDRSHLLKAGFFDETLRAGEDSDLYFRALVNAKACIVNGIHAIYFQGDDNLFFFKNKYDFSDSVAAQKHVHQKSYEIMHYKKVEEKILMSSDFKFRDSMLKTVYQILADKYSFLMNIYEHTSNAEDLNNALIKFEYYKKSSDSVVPDAGKYFYLAYIYRYSEEDYCASCKAIQSSELENSDFWVIAEDHVILLDYYDGPILYNVASSEKFPLQDTPLASIIQCKSRMLTNSDLDDNDFLDVLQSAIDKDVLRLCKTEKGSRNVELLSANNLFSGKNIAKGYKRDPKLLYMLEVHEDCQEFS